MKSKTYKTAFAELKVQTVRLCEAPVAELVDAPAVLKLWREQVTASSWYDADKEALVVFALNTRLRCTGFFLIALGALDQTVAHPREILKPLVASSAYGFIMAHNHPSGDPAPSEADRRLTRRIREASELLGIKLCDHIIVGDSYFSFRESGLV